MQSRPLEIFYLFFQGILIFQALVFGVLFFVTRRKDLLYYSLFLLFAAVYFFINAPYTFFGIPEDIVWSSAWYDYVNTPVIIVENLFYLLFLKAFFSDITTDKNISRVFRFVLWLVPAMILLFIILTILHNNKQFVFYSVKLITAIPAALVAYVVFRRKPPFASSVAIGLLFTITGTCITVCMIILGNNGVQHLFTTGYPLFFIRLGILGDMIFYLAAILLKWHFQERQLAIEKLQSQLAVENLRNKISSELHDDLGSTLSGISMYSHIISNLLQAGKYEQVKESAGIIQKSAGEMTEHLGDLVWAISPGQDTLQKLIEKLEEYAKDMAAVKNMQVRIVVEEEAKNIYVPLESRRNIYLLCKEAINNASKYSDATLLELIVKKSADKLEFSVSDNGKGFDAVMVRRGNGLDNMQKRADEIGAKLIVQSKENEGAAVCLQCKIT
ncbi:MAG: 7TM diverse intracellular signaling domain-containing protein [Chitinophagaceae bacterium]